MNAIVVRLPRQVPRTGRVRRGTVMPFFALVSIALFGFVALAIDIGMLAVNATECQAAADAAALVGTRTLDNKPTSVNSNRAAANTNARALITENPLFATKFTAANINNVRFGTYEYNVSAQQFQVAYPSTLAPGRSWTATEVSITGTQPSFFGRIFGVTGMQATRRAVAVHRPRDIALVMDMTGSMKFGSYVRQSGTGGAYLSADPVYPAFGHYQRYENYTANNPNVGSGAGSPGGRHNPFFTTAGFVNGSGELYAPHNYSVPTAGGPAAVKDFYFMPNNISNPSTPASAVDPVSLVRAFHHYEPGVSGAGDPDNYIAPTYNYGAWSGSYDPATFLQYPFPDTFADQSDPAYVGDRYARKRGRERTVPFGTTWNPGTEDGATINLAEYLGWIPDQTGTAPNATASSGNPGVSGQTIGTRSWLEFRDKTWERYGYGMNVNTYVSLPGRNPRTVATPISVGYDETRFKGFSTGPTYWGKTFFMWPPDPRWGTDTGTGTADPTSPSTTNPVKDTAGRWICDWRRRFFLDRNGNPFDPQVDSDPNVAGRDWINETLLRNGTGDPFRNMATISTANAQINYAAVLKWIKQPPMALPPNLRAGRVLYYTSIPDDVDTGSGTTTQLADKAFWRNYIDYVLRANNNAMTGVEGRGWPEGSTPSICQNDPTLDMGDPVVAEQRYPYMHYLDNPSRPRAQFWFGPLSMMSYLHNCSGGNNAWAATTHETQTWQLKAGMNSALDDIRNNHPNDAVGLAYFAHADYGFISVALGQEWQVLKDALFYPLPLIDGGQSVNAGGVNVLDPTVEYYPFNTNGSFRGASNIPNGSGGTDPNTGLAMAFNILSPNTGTLGGTRRPSPPVPYVSSTAGANRAGRRGASKIVIFETDGVPNSARVLTFNTQGFNSFYSVTGTGSNTGNGSAASMDAAYNVVNQIVKPMSLTAGGDSGMSSPNSPARVYSIGFGDLFSTPTATFQPTARNFLLEVQKRGNTSAAGDSAIPPEQIITGPSGTRIDNLRTCLERIMQAGVQVTLVE